MGSLGSYLKAERELRELSVAEVAQATRIPVRVLSQLESDEWDKLPADVFVRGYLRAYARVLGADETELLSRFEGRGQPEDLSAALPAVYAPESGRRFGIAIALVILLILFTLALSIVLRPRHRDTPVELSRVTDTGSVDGEACAPSLLSAAARPGRGLHRTEPSLATILRG